MLTIDRYFNKTGSYAELFDDVAYAWDALKRIKTYIQKHLDAAINGTVMDGAFLIGDDIFIGEGTIVEPGAYIRGPAIIGNNTEVRQGAYIRGNVLIGDNCVVGHATEIKHSVMLDGAKAGHFAYIGDSILGQNVNLGAGTKLANLKITPSTVTVRFEGQSYDTGLRKFGAILGDRVETGCNSVTTPGTMVGYDSLIYPNATVRGVIPPAHILKSVATQTLTKRADMS
ncbi:MAG: glucose-1-phosphate thymidylyltransferase [Gemmatimonadetes bacterium]|nr:MAG: glucose-1-phosphate thymidylyltransferase [Gemmatimonadota bacterium]